MSVQQLVAVASVSALSCEVTASTSYSHYLATLLQQAAGTVNLLPAQVSLPCQVVHKLQGPLLLSHISPNHRVGLLALTAAPALQEQYQQLIPLQRQTLYSATLLQHAALLLLLLVSDSLVLLIHTPAVPPAVLQLLHVLPKVKQQLLQQVHVLQKRSKTAAARGASEPQQHVAATGCDDATAAAEAAAAEEAPLSNEQQGSQQFDQLLQLLHKPPSQLHVVMQVSAANEAQAAVKQAEHTLIKCKAISAAADSSNKSSSMSRRPTSGNKSSSSSSGLLFELSGVHACADEECRTQGLRRAVLNAIQQQLLPPNAVKQPQPPPQQQPKEQHQSQQQLLTADRILADVAAAAGSSQSMSATVFKPEELQQVWQQLLALLFPTVHNSHGSSSSARYYPLYGMKPLQLDGTSTDDVILNSDDDADWDEVDDSWQEVRHAESSADGAESAAAAGDMLAAAVDPLYHMSLKRCSTAARAAFRAYLQAVPDRYPLSVHQHALKSALALYQSTAAGPAAADVRDALCCCCLTAWQSGRQQCSALSLTARTCGNTPHNVHQEPHTSDVTFTLAAPDGTEQQQQHQDWFSFTAANVQPAQTLLQQQQQQQQETSMHSSRLLQTVVHLLNNSDSSGTTAQAGSESKQQQQQQQQLILGPWLSLWSVPTHEFGSGSTAAAAATDGGSAIESSFITLPGQRWLPGLARLLPIRVWAPGGTRVAAGSCAAAAAGVIGGLAAETSPDDGDDDEDRTVADSATDGKDILKGILEGLHVKGSKAAAAAAGGKRGKGDRRGGKSAAAAGGGSDGSWSQTAARPGRRGRGGGARQETPPAAAAAVVLGPEEFPTLAEATTGAKKSAADGRLQQGDDSATPGADTSSTPQKGKRAAAAAAARTAGNIVQQQLLEAWSQLGQQQQPQYAGGSSSSSSHPDAALSYTAAVRAQQSVRGAAAAAKRGRGRGQRGAAAAAAAVTSGGVSSAPGGGGDKVPDMVVLTQLWIGLEYESLAGQRCMLQPQHLLKSVQQQQQRSDTPVAAARNLPGSRGGGRSGARGGRGTQQQQQQHGSSTPPVSARSPPAVGDHQGASGVEQLLLQDVPLFIHMAAAGIHGSSKASPAAAAAPVSGVGSTCQTSQPVNVELLQLKRIHIRTPPSPFTFASHPRIRFTAAATAPATAAATAPAPATAPAAAALAATAPAAVGVATAPGSSSAQPAATQPVTGSSSSSSNSVLEFTSSEGVVLPADSQLVLNLPQVFGAPADWVREVCAAAADAVAAAGVVMDPDTGTEHHVVAAASAEETAANCGESSVASTTAATASGLCDSSTGTAAIADADEGNTSSTSGPGQVLLPLLPIETPQASSTTYPSAAAAAVTGAVSIGNSPASTSRGLWHAVLCAGSWLYPVAPEP